MVAEVFAWVFNTVAVLVLWPTSLPCPVKPEFDLGQLRSVIDGAMPMSCYAETEMTELNVPCTMIFMIFLFLFLILLFFSEWPFCLLFMICFQLPFCLAKPCVAWLGDDVSLLEKSCPFSDSLQCPSAWPNLWSSRLPLISWCERFNDVASLCSASAGMLYSSGFPEGLCGRSFHRAVSWECDTCVLQLSQSDTLELFPPRFTSLHGAETVSTDQHLRRSQVPRALVLEPARKRQWAGQAHWLSSTQSLTDPGPSPFFVHPALPNTLPEYACCFFFPFLVTSLVLV